jgi:hypothetical protein
MPKVNFVKAAAKDNRVAKKGESYYWWKFRFGGKYLSKTPPRPSQLTQSDFLSRQMELEERIADLTAETYEQLKSEVDEIVGEIEALGEEQDEKLNNMPDSLQQGPTGELLEGRSSACQDWAGELEEVDLEKDEPTEEDAKEALEMEEPTIDTVELDDLEEDQTREDKLAEMKKLYEEELAAKLEELRDEYNDELQEALAEIQGMSYQGE